MTTRAMASAIKRAAKPPVSVGLGLLGLALLGSDTALAAFPGHNGQVAFQSNRHGNNEIYTVNPDGRCEARLTHNSTFDGFPAWSPDGRKIAFRSFRDGVNEIYVMDADGSNQTRLTHNDAFDGGPTWSPDGRKIAFRSDRDGAGQIYVMDADGSNQTRLTHTIAQDAAPSWSPDGQRIAFASIRDDHETPEIYVMNADGSNQTRLTHTEAEDSAPDWSPDGQRIAFDSNREGSYDIYVMNADGSEQTRLTDHARADGGPAWSPDGQKIAFRTRRDRIGGIRFNEIYVMNADGSEQTRLTDNPWGNRRAAWQPLPLPSNNFCLGNARQNTQRGFVRQRVMAPGPGTVMVRGSERVRRFAREVEEAGPTGVLIRPRGRPKRRLDRAGTVRRRMRARVRAEIGFRPADGRRRTETVRVWLVRIARP